MKTSGQLCRTLARRSAAVDDRGRGARCRLAGRRSCQRGTRHSRKARAMASRRPRSVHGVRGTSATAGTRPAAGQRRTAQSPALASAAGTAGRRPVAARRPERVGRAPYLFRKRRRKASRRRSRRSRTSRPGGPSTKNPCPIRYSAPRHRDGNESWKSCSPCPKDHDALQRRKNRERHCYDLSRICWRISRHGRCFTQRCESENVSTRRFRRSPEQTAWRQPGTVARAPGGRLRRC